MSIAPISSLPNLPPLAAPQRTTAAGASPPGTTAAGGSSGGGFTNALGNAIDSLNSAQQSATTQEIQTAAGQGTLANTMIAATKASLDTQVATSLINKALAAYTSIATMPI
jgi:flagellar hook-basal body complex protein FliE